MSQKTCKALTLYFSAGGNTRKVAEVIDEKLRELGVESRLENIDEQPDVDYFDYQLVFVGAPVYAYLPPEQVTAFLKACQKKAEVLPAAPEKPGHFAVTFCTYGGPHSGPREAVPALKYMGQFFEHAGIRVVDEWAVVGEFHAEKRKPMNIAGRLGDITNRPNEADLADIRGRVLGLLRRLKHKLPGIPADL
ncbi:MAG: flavodoxin family protein [Phycisphaerae bacterium]